MNALLKLAWLPVVVLISACAAPRVQPDPPPPLPQPELRTPPQEVTGGIFQAGRDVRLYEDRIARRVGDLVTIILEEQTAASKDANANITRSSEANIGVPIFGGRAATIGGNPLSASAEADRSFQGGGTTGQSNQLQGTLTATVIEVHPNGNLVVQGQKKLTLNRGDEYVTVNGVIRPEDLGTGNTISSTRIANAQISYTGTGALADASQMGWLQRLFFSIWMPM
ncbi:flagellar basal body L-ring protein [Alkalilimnicola ehrlichii]|uniref:Flagellar L-ring protein n=1 Tax=Alkalilimnicola ehrlichii TaxID=351052 RepID=A0A3E0WU60_9GAMM|nr:flagellar basal body L-ring protein FlgH [Alkalilimnicola ehrlichii]RFA28559.1 flagellar basal body L-ring protein [Alkalilimnicola ehrlichii]RFA35723.1 flagellar basal body L-ring protein [Alkalilimnicola ehrlichii]